jgi:ligand-binding SRPBCC domain-containing protein
MSIVKGAGSPARPLYSVRKPQRESNLVMREFIYEQSQTVDAPIDRVFAFFSDARNLTVITPHWINFQIRTPQPIEMKKGLRIDYSLRIHGMPLKWQSEITRWDPPHIFMDEQRKGPYKYWIHEHRFASENGRTRVSDHVRYAVTGGVVVQRLFVAKDIEKIFSFRKQKLREIFVSERHEPNETE